MTQPPIAALDGLRRRLAEALGRDSLLYRRLAAAIGGDEPAMTAAMDGLRLYPAETRRKVEDAMVLWLFDVRDERSGRRAVVDV